MGRDGAVAARGLLIAETAAAGIYRTGLGKVEVARLVGLQVADEFMEALRRHDLVGEVFVEIRFPVSVRIVEARYLITAARVDDIIDDDEAKGFVKAGRESTPPEPFQGLAQTGNDPDVSVVGRNG